MTDQELYLQIIARLAGQISQLEDVIKMAQKAVKQADLVESSPNLVKKPLEMSEIEDVTETCDYIAKIVANYRERLVFYGMEPNLAKSLAKDLSGRLWSDVLEGEQ